MDGVSFKLPAQLRKRLAEEARRRRMSQGAFIRESLQATLLDHAAARGELSCADLAGQLIHLQEALLADHYKQPRGRRVKKRRR